MKLVSSRKDLCAVKDSKKRPWKLVLSVLTLLLASNVAFDTVYSQDFLKKLLTKSPGPLSEAHKTYDAVSGCISCHTNKLGGDLENSKCASCHTEIKIRLEENRGYHRGKTECHKCHADHKGLDHDIFGPTGWKENFDHDETGYSLLGKHRGVDCEKCHTTNRIHIETKQPTKTRTYLGNSTDCVSCHEKDYEHKFSKEKWKDCILCHTSNITDWKPIAKTLRFKHDETNYKLEGLHQKVGCNDCHKPNEEIKRLMEFAPLAFQACTDCHVDPHKGKFGSACTTCHSVYRPWDKVTLSSAAKAAPGSSKKSKDQKENQKKKSKDSTEEGFDHSKTRYPLKGYHNAVSCESCHYDESTRFKIDSARFDECSDCHTMAHGDQFKGQSCESCHVNDKKFTMSTFGLERHNKLGFELTGKHQVIDCQKCHFDGQYEKVTYAECSDCHRNPHDQREIDQQCDFCHVTTSFAWIKFDHNRQTDFKLTGKHRDVACTSCHVMEIFKDMPADNSNPNCQSCHSSPHGTSMPMTCQDCHSTDNFKKAKTFDHKQMGRWELSGAHREISCEKCHADHLNGSYTIERSSGASTTACITCHNDIHQGKHGDTCESCHSTSTFEVTLGAQVHDLGFFKLEGAHDKLGCNDCHRPDTQLQGNGVLCATCHSSTDPHLGKLGPHCSDCHRQTAWLPTTFKHNRTAFRLSGAHRFVSCESCHKNQTYQGLPSDCYFCHSDSMVTGKPGHDRSSVIDCADCHSQISWTLQRGSGLGLFPGGRSAAQ